jgi:hypothetical protein
MFGELSEGLSEPERASRLALLERLYADGYSLEELKTASAAGRLSLLPVERLLARRRRHSLTDAAHAADLGDEFAEVNHRSLGSRSRSRTSRSTTTTRSRTSRSCAACSTSGCPRTTCT